MNELRVISGLHRGVSLPLDGDIIIVGSSLDADIALVDPGIADQHIKIESTNKLPPDCWLLTVVQGDTWDEHGRPIADIVTAKLNRKFNIGGTWLIFSDEKEPWPSGDIAFINQNTSTEKTHKNKNFLIKAYSVAAGVLIGVVTLTHAGGGEPANQPPAQNASPELVSSLLPREDRATPKRKTLPSQELLNIFKKMLKERNLQHVNIVVTDNRWELQGVLESVDLEKLKRMKIRFTKKYGESIEIVDNAEPMEHSLPFSIVKVVSGPMGHIEADDGHKLYIGNDYKGMKLVGINNDTIMFSGKNNIEVKW